MARQGVIFDLVAAQSPSYRGRGIARFGTDFVKAMARYHPELVRAVVVHPDLAPVEGMEELGPWLTTRPDWSAASVLHLSSVFEPEVAVSDFWPRGASANGLLTAATVYDLIPDLWPDVFMQDPGLRRRWRCCREVARTADRVLTLSESARSDVVRMLGVPAEHVHFIGSAVSSSFHRTGDPERAWRLVQRSVPGIQRGFVIYVGAINPRKNVDGLMHAYAALPRYLIERHQLVVQCAARPLERNHYLVMAEKMGLRGRILFPGYKPEDVLVALYQSAELNIFPSLYEGYGLPVMEAMACGAPSMAGENSSLVELLPEWARFDASDPAAIADAMARALTDQYMRQRLLALTAQPPATWRQVADRAAGVFEDMMAQAARHRRPWRARPQVALVGAPREIVVALAEVADVDAFDLPGPAGPERAEVTKSAANGAKPLAPGLHPWAMSYRTMARLEHWRSGYDAIACWLGPGARGADGALQVAGDWPGRVVLVGPEGHGLSPAQLRELGEAEARILTGPSTAEGAQAWLGPLLARVGPTR